MAQHSAAADVSSAIISASQRCGCHCPSRTTGQGRAVVPLGTVAMVARAVPGAPGVWVAPRRTRWRYLALGISWGVLMLVVVVPRYSRFARWDGTALPHGIHAILINL